MAKLNEIFREFERNKNPYTNEKLVLERLKKALENAPKPEPIKEIEEIVWEENLTPKIKTLNIEFSDEKPFRVRIIKPKKIYPLTKEWLKRMKSNPEYILKNKIKRFTGLKGNNLPFGPKDVIEKFGENPKCYLTGLSINYSDSSTYSFDHIIPQSKGGPNTLDNLGLSHPIANIMKNVNSVEELKKWCDLISNYLK